MLQWGADGGVGGGRLSERTGQVHEVGLSDQVASLRTPGHGGPASAQAGRCPRRRHLRLLCPSSFDRTTMAGWGFIHSLTHDLLTHSLTHSSTYSFAYPQLFIHPFIYARIHWLMHSFTCPSFIRSHTSWLTHSLSYYPPPPQSPSQLHSSP